MVAIAAKPDVARVPCLWPGQTVVCIGSGPSLSASDAEYCRGRAPVIAVKDAVRMAPWADVLYGAGSDSSKWWQRPDNRDVLAAFEGLRFTIDPDAKAFATVLQAGDEFGLSSDPERLALGHNSGYQAINLAILMGATRVVLLGYDMQRDARDRDHFFGQHPRGNRPPFAMFLWAFERIVEPLAAAGVTVVNCSRSTALTIFQRMSLAEALP